MGLEVGNLSRSMGEIHLRESNSQCWDLTNGIVYIRNTHFNKEDTRE